MPPALGHGSLVGIGLESEWGTAVARTLWTEIASGGLKRTIARRRRPHLGVPGASSVARSFFTESDDAGGSLEIPLTYDNPAHMVLLGLAFGTVTDAGSGPSGYTHTFDVRHVNADSLPPGVTIEQTNGVIDAEVFSGCLPSGFEISMQPGSPVMLTLSDVIGKTSGGLVPPTEDPTIPTAEPIDFDDVGQLTFNSVSYDAVSVTITGARKLERRRRLGSLNTAKPAPSDVIEVEITAVLEHGEATSPHAAWLAGTTGNVTITATGPGGRAAAFTLHGAYLDDVSTPVNTVGILQSTVKWIGLASASDNGLRLVLTNGVENYDGSED